MGLRLYGIDAQHVYVIPDGLKERRLDILHPDTVRFLGEDYVIDKGKVYFVNYLDGLVSEVDADPATFEVTEFDDKNKANAKDKNNFYLRGKVVSTGGLNKTD